MATHRDVGTVVLVGASRGLGLAATKEFLARGWSVVATVRNLDSPAVVDLAAQLGVRLRLERLDITDEADIEGLRDHLADTHPDILYVNAGITDADVPVGDVPTDVFVNVMVTNALAPMRIVERIGPLVRDDGVIAVVSSRQGSVSHNTLGGHEVYRASKAALNQLMRS